MESSTSSTFTGDEFRLHLCSRVFTSYRSPALMPPTLQLHFDFRPSSPYFPQPFPYIRRDYRDVCSLEVEVILLNVLRRGGRGWSSDIPRLAISYCRYLRNVIRHSRARHCRYIVVNALITVAGHRAGQLLVPAWPRTALVDDVVVLTEAEDRPRGGEGSSDTPEKATAAWAESIRVDIFGEREAEKAYADCTCSICLTDFKAGEKLLVLPCHHRFHPQCLERWLDRKHTCPFCRFDLSLTVPVPIDGGINRRRFVRRYV